MKIIKILGVVVFTILLIILIISGLDYALSDDVESYARIEMHELYEQDHIDSLFLGPSHVYRGIDPAITDEKWDENTFDCSTSAQKINTSYALLREADRVADIDTCYLEMSVGSTKKEVRDERIDEVYRVSDYMKWSWNKVSYILDAVNSEEYVNAFCRARRNWKNIYSLSTMKDIVSRKSQDDYKNFAPVKTETYYYVEKGFIYQLEEYENVNTMEWSAVKDPIHESYRYYFQKIVQYCQENDIKLIGFSIPVSEYMLECIGNYDDYYVQAKALCEEYGVSYYDFNLADSSVLGLQDNNFMDANHLNGTGAEKFTKVFADFFAGEIEEDELFYDSYEEKREHLPKRFIGIVLKRNSDKDICRIKSVTTKEDKYKYEVFYQDKDGNDILLREKSANRKIELPTKEKMVLKVKVYDSKDNEIAEFNRNI